MMDINKKYFALDLELNNAPDNSTPNPKIIQVGIAIGNYCDYLDDKIDTYKWYFNPKEKIYPFITGLTGITDDDIITHGASHEFVANSISDLLTANQCFLNPITWGSADSGELKAEFRERNIPFLHFGRRWIDLKTLFVLDRVAEGKSPGAGLRSAMAWYHMKFIGEPHRADNDAFNTLRLWFKMLENKNRINKIIDLIRE
jgi:hypothetical protein